jgi:hypothetical protein
MWELLAIKAEPDGPALRLRHFSPDLTPWKGECDAIPVLKATTLDPTRVVFTNASDVGGLASCEYDCTTPDTLAITVSFKPQTNRPPLKFQLQRVKG